MPDFFFISYSVADGKDFAGKLYDDLTTGPPPIPVWLDKHMLIPGEDWDEQIADAIRTCKGMIFVMTNDSVRADSVCKLEWVRALKYKKPIIPLLLTPTAELPFRLGSRQYINFDGSFETGIDRLRKHVVWMASPAGHLQALKHRLSDAQRELPRAEKEKQPRIQEDIADLERQIAQQQKIIDDPKAAEERVQHSIEVGLEGERKPAKPVGGIASSKFINPPPLVAPNWFQDRHSETRQIGDFLKDESLRLITVVGRGGVGKSAMVCRLLRSLEGGQLPDDGGPLTVDGIVYLSAARSFHRTNVPDLYSGLTRLLPDETVKQLDSIYKNPKATTRATIEALLQNFSTGRTVVLLDNFEDMLDVESGKTNDADLKEALTALLELPPHGIKLIITTRVAPTDLALVKPNLQRRLDLGSGLEHPYAESILRSMDADGKVGLRDAPESLLSEARVRTLGYPRALEHLFGILSADRDTSLQQILEDTKKFLPEQVVTVLVGEAFSRLDITAQRVMQALAVYRYPVSPAAIDFLLQPHVPGVDSGRVLSRLVNMQFVHRDAGRYYLHQVDRDYALTRIPEGDPADRDAEVAPLTLYALRHRAAEWFKLSRKPREEWKTLGDLAAQLSEFELRCEGGDYDTAAALLREFDYDYLHLWGHYRLMIELHERLLGKISDPGIMLDSTSILGTAYYRTGQIQKAISFDEKALVLARDQGNRWSEGALLGNLGTSYQDLGQHSLAMKHIEEALEIHREVGNKLGEANTLSVLAIAYTQIGQNTRAVKYYEQALQINREIGSRESEALTLNNLGACFYDLGRREEAQVCYTDALDIAFEIGYRLIESASHAGIGELHSSENNWDEVVKKLGESIEIADVIGNIQVSQASRVCLALVHLYQNKFPKAQELLEAARSYDVPLNNHSTAAVRGVVATRCEYPDLAKKSFSEALAEANQLIALNADEYRALDTIGLSHCGLALCGDLSQIAAAKAAYLAARRVTKDIGIVQAVLKLFDALALADTKGLIAEVRPYAEGTKSFP